MNVTARPYTIADYPALLAIQQACFPPPFPVELLWSRAQIASHVAVFPAGTLLALVDGRPAGSATAHILHWDPRAADHTWRTAAADGMLTNHDPHGDTLYGVDIAVMPELRRQGIGRALNHAHQAMVRSLGLRRFLAGCRLAGWHRHRHLDHATYVAAVVRGDLSDPVITPQLRAGLVPVQTVHDYLPDEESGNAALLMEWLNPDLSRFQTA